MIDAILQHMGFYVTIGNPNVMMRENHNTQSSEYIIMCQDGLYIVSTTPEEIIYTRSISIYRINIHMILVERIIIKSKNILNIYMKI